jgi:arylsulfatase A-like enzyme
MSNTAPNILFITSDEQHPDCLGLVDNRIKTPHLDRLSAEGMLLARSYTCAPICTPARATWITGQYPSKHGAWTIGTILDKQCLSVATLLGQAGYRTAMIGKSHLQPCHAQEGRSEEGPPRSKDTGFHRRWHGPWYGFEHAEINTGHTTEPHSASMHYRTWLEDHGVDIDKYFNHAVTWNVPMAWDLPEQFHPCAWVAERASAFLRSHATNHAEQPFFLSLQFPEPHWPFRVQEPFFSMYNGTPMRKPTRQWGEWEGKPAIYRALIEDRVNALGWHTYFGLANLDPSREALKAGPQATGHYTDQETARLRTYWRMITLMDVYIGRVLACLDELGLTGNTLVVFTSDHGDLMGDHFLVNKGACHYDGCVRVPTLVRWPGRIKPASRNDALASGVDLAPTFMAAAGLTPHPQMQGVSQLEVWKGHAPSARRGVWIDFRAERGLYVNSWITNRYRLSVHRTPDGEEFELYDLQEDPGEFKNLATDPANAALVSRLLAQMLSECTSTACAWQERIAGA